MSDRDDYEPIGTDRPYVESQVIMTTVRVVAPFTFTYGLFLTFHGGESPGGGFQGGAIIGATVLMIAFAFGIESAREWLSNRVVVGLASGGVAMFVLVGLIPLALGGRFLEHKLFTSASGVYKAKAYALEAVEIVGVMPIVAGVVVGLFFAIAAGYREDDALVDGGTSTAASQAPGADEGGDSQ